ncbi:MAG: HAD family phosphatase [Caldilineaceae bacterium]|nr:HAD family phosphatase [Caldilineaceae bacterium]
MMQPKPIIRAVIFDMDGLMLDTERLAQEAWQQAGADLGYDLPDEIYRLAIGRTAQATAEIFGGHFGADSPFDEIYQRKQQYYHTAIEEGRITLKAGLLALLAAIEERALPKAVATSTARPLALQKLAATNLLPHFTTIVCGNEVPNGKPAPDIFLAAAAKLAVTPADCLVLEDSPAGIRAAHAAGMIPILIPDLVVPPAEVRQLAYQTVTSLYDVLPLIAETHTTIG